MIVDPLVWAKHKRLQLSDGVLFEMTGRPYLVGLLSCDKKDVSCKKGAQICATTGFFIQALHACVHRRYTKNILYLMPTVKQVEMVAKVSFDPIFNYNGWLKKMTSNNSASIKTINGRSIIFLGAQPQNVGDSKDAKDSVNLRSYPADVVIRDEIDLMDIDMVEMSKQRLLASDFGLERNFGSPTIPGWGIDKLYDEGDQREWIIPCRSCGKHSSLVREFPRSIIKKDGRWFRACVHCHNEVFVCDGDWHITYPDRRAASFWVDGLINPKADLDAYMYRFNNSDTHKLAEFQRSVLGQAVIEAGCQLSVQDVLGCCGSDGLHEYSTGETCMGVDVGDTMHVVVGTRTGKDTFKILNVTSVTDFGQLHDLAKKMNVKFCVIDKGPDIHGVKQFQAQEPYAVYRCQYSEFLNTAPDFNRETGIVKCNRNEMCDQVHAVFTNNKIAIPRQCTEITKFAEQLTKMAKDTQKNPETGVPKTKWVKTGDKQDHWFHSTIYFLMAASRISPSKSGQPAQRFTHTKSTFVLR